jgi:hypothetical protein
VRRLPTTQTIDLVFIDTDVSVVQNALLDTTEGGMSGQLAKELFKTEKCLYTTTALIHRSVMSLASVNTWSSALKEVNDQRDRIEEAWQASRGGRSPLQAISSNKYLMCII